MTSQMSLDDTDNDDSQRIETPSFTSNAQFTFGWNPGANNTDANTNPDSTSSNTGGGGFQFGVPITPDSNTNTTNNNNGGGAGEGSWIFGTAENSNNASNGGVQFGSTENNTANAGGGGWTFGAFGTTSSTTNNNNGSEQSNASAAAANNNSNGAAPPSNFVFQTNAIAADPFAAFNAPQSQSEMQTDSQEESQEEQKEDQKEEPRPRPLPPSPPQINEALIDRNAMEQFLQLYTQQMQAQWSCVACSLMNSTACFKCKACETARPGFTGEEAEVDDDDSGMSEKDKLCMQKKIRLDRAYFDVLSHDKEILEYHPNFHPKPQYFPYQHEQCEAELEEEGALTSEAWTQFDPPVAYVNEDEEDDKQDDTQDGADDDGDDQMSPPSAAQQSQDGQNGGAMAAVWMDSDNDTSVKQGDSADGVNGVQASKAGKEEVVTPGGDDEQAQKTDDDEKNDDEAEEDADKRVTVYREYKRRRTRCKQQIDAVHRRLESGHRMVAIAGMGDVTGVLGVGNGSVSQIPDNMALFPFVLESLLDKSMKLIAAGPQTSAAVTVDDEIFVWGSNDHALLTIDPLNPHEIDVGDEDDQLNTALSYERLFAHYEQAITDIYAQHNPDKLREQPHFIAAKLAEQKMGKVTLHVGDAQRTTAEPLVLSDGNLELLMRAFMRTTCVKPSKKVPQKTVVEIDIAKTSIGMRGLYLKIAGKYKLEIPPSMRQPFIPKTTAQDLLARKQRKLNPYRFLQRKHSSPASSAAVDKVKRRRSPRNHDSSNGNSGNGNSNSHNHNHKHDQNHNQNGHSNGNSSNARSNGYTDDEYHYEQKEEHAEDAFQKDISCVYYTPAHIRLPCKCVVQQVTLGGSHMVVLDALGRVFSSGTFLNESVVGHHYDHELKEIVRYQRTLKRIVGIDSVDDNTHYKQLPLIKFIASGLHHFLMLDEKGDIWSMGITKLGQRWNPRLTKQYLCPRRIAVINQTQKCRTKRRVRFSKVACGAHHNLAISEHGHLFSWGNNKRLQCGHSNKHTGYGDTIDHPRFVTFWENKKDVEDDDETNVAVADYDVVDVVAGDHMTVALDRNGRVWSCGRNACTGLGRPTKWDGYKKIDGTMVKQEVREDLMRMVTDLKHLEIDWIGCGAIVWYAHNKANGTVYAFGDCVNGRGGVGYWKSGARGRPVVDEYNLDLKHYKVVGCQGGSEHMMMLIEKKPKAHARRQSVVITPSVDAMAGEYKHGDEQQQRVVVVDENSNHSNSTTSSNTHNGRKIVPQTAAHPKRQRKRRRSQITPERPDDMADIPETNTLDEQSDVAKEKQPKRKKHKLNKAKTSTVRTRPSKTKTKKK